MNKKKFFFALVLLSILVLFVILNTTKTQGKRELISELKPLECDLNVRDCMFDFKGKKVLVKTSLKPLASLQEFELILENLGDYKKLNARIYGLNMYMGDIVPSFEKIHSNSYKANIVLSACVIDIMRFRMEFFEGEEKLDFYFDFDVKR
ncbi:hypothetical protein [Campylobacter sp. MIT 97-5078]|uniref:hypothetical protein n=1 Tax=Campylobacter sp. MIT 97-5078 TaxID=1548153 RepID=UPI0005140288|nr:hypothetical protein [Campylobacter sp. MIT 97-5078]KGI56737.1 hypothetical protein LR59_05845 [Campylobacter sp. MIT 97-5078]KGI57208.1 hypothetical protein LR59_00215 [Campylobacter sp. MIT 97-5078]TQR27594.1 hypothetical protein DMB91_03080 [Campylobacter sp. MIT 97-5078]